MKSTWALLAAFAAFLAFAGAASAQIDSAPKVRARLVAEATEIAPGGSLQVALEEAIRPGWHTYWRNPGQAGQPTTIDWALPAGWKASPFEWPYPKRLPAGPLMNYGYEGRTWLLLQVSAPADARPGDVVTLKGHASWLVCSDQLCVPEDGDVGVSVTVSATPAAPYATVAEQFAAARALLPVSSPWAAHFRGGDGLDIFLAAPKLAPRSAAFFPFEEGFVKGTAEQQLGTSDGGVVLRIAQDAKAKLPRVLAGVLVLTSRDGSVQALEIAAMPGTVPTAQFAGSGLSEAGFALLFAFLGGLILNLMPCVLPILAMKALAVASHAAAHRTDAAREGLSYGAGAILSFLALALAVILLRAGGDAVGWGFQLQEPRVVAGFALLMFAVGLNLSGVFEVPGFSGGDALAHRSGVAGAFFTGVLAVAVAAPCTAPFMATAIGYALTQGTVIALLVFFFLGLGFAAPFIAIGLSPALVRLLPKPGVWMLHFKQLLAFPMYGAAAWLVWVVSQEAGQIGLAATLAALVAFSFAVWAWSATRNSPAGWRVTGSIVALVGLALALAGLGFAMADASPSGAVAAVEGETALHPEPYSAQRLADLRAEKRPIFLDATAAWCITCLVNEKVALSRPDVAAAFASTRTAYLVADWTKRDAAITALLSAHGRSGVPLYLYYAPGAADADVLPQVLTPDAVLAAVSRKP